MPAKTVNIKSLARFRTSLANLSILTDIAKDMEKHNVSKLDRKLEFLYRSYIVHLIVLWQSFIKSLAREAHKVSIKERPLSVNKFLHIVNIDQVISHFHTPDTQHIDLLFFRSTLIKNISNNWRWDGMSNEMAKNKLDKLIMLQSFIANAGYGRSSLTYEGNFDCADFLLKIAEIMSAVVANYILGITGNSSIGEVADQSE